MKPIAKKGLIAIVVLYALTVGVMITNFLREARPEDPEEATRAIQQVLNDELERAYDRDPEHIRDPQRPITDAEAARVFEELFPHKGTIININYTLIMQCLNFAILLLVLYGYLWDPLLQFLDKRRALISERLDDAARSRKEAEGLLQQRHHELGQLRSERGGIVEQAKSLGEQERGRIVERARREAEMLMQQTEERLGEEVRRARVALREEVAELAVRVAAQVLKREISRQDHDTLIEDVVARMTLTQEPPPAGGPE